MQNKKGCGCGNKNIQSAPEKVEPNTVQTNQQALPKANVSYIPYPVKGGIRNIQSPPPKVQPEQNRAIEFQKRQVEDAKSIKEQIGKKLSMVQSFASAIASRGLANNRINKPIKQLRVLSCFGNQAQGGQLPPCEYLKDSTTMPGKHFCGGCGCGDKPHTWLVAEGEQYSKLDYPRLNCPLKMPGFTNYEPSKPEEAGPNPSRRNYIENINYSEIEKISVTLPEMETPPPTA